ncbi:MAG: MFS transporter [bacterium]|nr:MFS transporter [bacterium]
MSETLRNDRKTIFGWAMYDWAVSAYSVTLAAILPAFFAEFIVGDDGWNGWSAETIWSGTVSIGSLALFLAMPILGAIADYGAFKRSFMGFFMLLGVAFTAAAALVPDRSVPLFTLMVLGSYLAFVASNVFYDGFLTDITTDDTVDHVSSKGYAYGYVGGGILLIISLGLLFLSGEESVTGLSTNTAARIAIVLSGLWWIGFGLYSLSHLHDSGESRPIPSRYAHSSAVRTYIGLGFGRTFATARKLRYFPHLMAFIIAYIFYNDGTQTVISVSGAFASETLDLDLTTITSAFLLVQFVAFGGALLFGMVSYRMGPKRAILWCIAIFGVLTGVAYFLPTGQAIPFYGLAALVGLVLGGVQALSRSLYATMIPVHASAEFFGFFTVFSKFSAIWGPLVYSLVSHQTGSGRPAVFSLVFFFLIGGVLLARVDVEKARSSRDQWTEA